MLARRVDDFRASTQTVTNRCWAHPHGHGSLTNNAGAQLVSGFFNNTTDVMNLGGLTNKGLVSVGLGSILNLTSQPNGITDVVAGSEFDVFGTFKAGAASALAKLGSVEGNIFLENGQSTTITPTTAGNLTIASTGLFDLDRGSNVTISGNVTNSGQLNTNRQQLRHQQYLDSHGKAHKQRRRAVRRGIL